MLLSQDVHLAYIDNVAKASVHPLDDQDGFPLSRW